DERRKREGETEVPGSVGVRDVCCRKFRGQKPKIESDVETHPSLIYRPFCMVFLWVTFEILRKQATFRMRRHHIPYIYNSI
ncbi:hypothetical protein BRARA_B01489, partial [Brassica rapa]